MTINEKNCGFHPDESMLMRVSLGKADITETLIVEAHIHYCSKCYDKYFQFQENLLKDYQSLETLEKVSHDIKENDLILSTLNDKLDDLGKSEESPSDPIYELLPPAILSSIDDQSGLKWNSFWPSKGKVSLLATDRVGQYQLFFGIIDPGATLPVHKHCRSEQTLVLKGQYISGGQVFEAGEWSESAVGDEHAPGAGINEPCYCLIRANKHGYKFTGSSRWRNPLVRIFN